ncbi:MAG: hypothetical protein JGK01_01405 [Microcoleus sp. PH2017_03_ELD_O_A]|nr:MULTISPECIES: hypothetical protein [unclassified Microcoleus]MCC3440481.1 hypothetical protein [Microcoleus sp. PH2017_03_ELD_O_A]MCC3525601.1 hypothetical protein [Microcoleus sp. PH2017_20_SFW_D_A]MCC3546417.1 hypothetical protein [Microcoleus sp. PH2017_24_DOB_U_A]MCC3556586.1 hypothetical protein [Microcoleus sp. PH2017_35_SFW_U_B]MCC3566547.1 hypothetical protein [Microcoleus sp. PH2017_31_RDM_U_A]MCC3582852.1 hypothetical protein [Microcoleus sp. PH2017_30_WIL_O_A]
MNRLFKISPERAWGFQPILSDNNRGCEKPIPLLTKFSFLRITGVEY